MRPILFEIGPIPNYSIRAGSSAVCPKIRPPQNQRRHSFCVVECASVVVNGQSSHLVDLRFDRPFHRESTLIRIGLGIQIDRGIATVGTAGKKDDTQVRIAYPHRPKNESKVRQKEMSIGAVGWK